MANQPSSSDAGQPSHYKEEAGNEHSPGPGPSSNTCCLINPNRQHCTLPAGQELFSRGRKVIVTRHCLHLTLNPKASHIYMCDHHAGIIEAARVKPHRKGSEMVVVPEPVMEVNFEQLAMSTLRKYKKTFKLSAPPNANKAQMVEVVSQHFNNIPVNEEEIISTFYRKWSKASTSKTDPQTGP